MIVTGRSPSLSSEKRNVLFIITYDPGPFDAKGKAAKPRQISIQENDTVMGGNFGKSLLVNKVVKQSKMDDLGFISGKRLYCDCQISYLEQGGGEDYSPIVNAKFCQLANTLCGEDRLFKIFYFGNFPAFESFNQVYTVFCLSSI